MLPCHWWLHHEPQAHEKSVTNERAPLTNERPPLTNERAPEQSVSQSEASTGWGQVVREIVTSHGESLPVTPGASWHTPQKWETLMSTQRNKCGMSRFLQGRVSGGLLISRLTQVSSIVCFLTQPICVLANNITRIFIVETRERERNNQSWINSDQSHRN